MWPPASAGGRWVASPSKSYAGAVAGVFPCGGCQGCRARRTAEWTARLWLESQYHAETWFITWTYDNDHVPADYSICPKVVQKLHKRVRRQFGEALRFFTIGEYGSAEDATRRPHYHTLAYGLVLRDLTDERRSERGFPIWKSPRLELCWTDPASGKLRGFVDVAKADRESMSYVAGYHFKKLGGPRSEEAYRRIHPVTGEVLQVRPEFALMSRRPGIGFRWAEEFRESDLRHNDVRIAGRAVGMPGYLRRKELEWMPGGGVFSDAFMAKLKRSCEAKAAARERAADLTPERLAVREEHHFLRTQHLARGGAR